MCRHALRIIDIFYRAFLISEAYLLRPVTTVVEVMEWGSIVQEFEG